MIDIVLDTCTLVHADNSESDYQESSAELINRMFANSTLVTVDDGFTFDESTNQSYIGLEFIKHLRPGSLGYSLIVHLALNMRINFVSNVIPNATKNYIEQIIRNKKDRMFLRVADPFPGANRTPNKAPAVMPASNPTNTVFVVFIIFKCLIIS